MKNKINLYVISGFLGSGKTTFLKHLLQKYQSKKLGVLINEFGVIGIDGSTIHRNGIEYVEVNNGSIFCSCIKADFVKTLIALQKTDIDTLIIENSGLADPSSMNNLLDEISHLTERGYQYHGAICIVDCSTFLKYADMLPPLKNQVLSSNLIVLNKTDLANEQTIINVEQRVIELNEKAMFIKTVDANVPTELLEANLMSSDYYGQTCNHPWNRPETYTILLNSTHPRSSLEQFTTEIGRYALRIKGFADTPHGWVHIDAVEDSIIFNTMADSAGDLSQKHGIVIIGRSSTPFKDKITTLWETLMDETPVFAE